MQYKFWQLYTLVDHYKNHVLLTDWEVLWLYLEIQSDWMVICLDRAIRSGLDYLTERGIVRIRTINTQRSEEATT